jgi:hypothetical protein
MASFIQLNMLPQLNNSDFLRFTDKIRVADGCWEWQTPGDPKHYPKFKISKGKTVDAHRLSYQIFKGFIAPGQYICHHCDNRRCTNPEHLFAGTPKDNAIDAYEKGRIIPPTPRKLSEFQIAQIKRALREGKLQKTIALEFGVCRSTVSNISQGLCWKEIA